GFMMQPDGEDADDYVRVMYVAAPRAKRHLALSSYSTSDEGKQLLASPIISTVPETIITKPEQNEVETLETKLRWPALEDKDAKQLLAPLDESFALSHSTLIEFLDITEAGPAAFKDRRQLIDM